MRVVENMALLLQLGLDSVGVGEDLPRSQAGFAHAGKGGCLTAAGYIYTDGQYYDDTQATEGERTRF